jgi:adenylate cyclase
MLNLRQGLRRNGELLGFLIAAVRVRDLSDHLRNLNPINGGTVFVLYGRDRVLAHPNLLEPRYRRSAERPLLRLEEVGDPLLASIWETEGRQPLRIIKGTDLKGHVLQRSNGTYVYIYKDLEGLGDKAWQIGTYFRNSAINREMRRLRSALLVGLGMLAMAVLLAVILARRISRPVVELARAASRIGQLDISATQPLPGSIFRELDDQARAFNAMLQGLGWFETYVPKRLVRRLIRQSASGLPASEDREVTVMFTDIAGFTGLAEGKPAAEVASFLNSHFSLLARCIESEEGTVDKFIGDSVMAFWGAPDDQPDHRERAVRAARAICKALTSDNAERRAKGLEPIRVRIGLHSGRVTVGNIGAPGRINYTIVGDTVNVGQRLEAYGKTLAARDVADGGAVSGVIVLVSAATVDMLADTSDLVSIGAVRLQGRDMETKVYRLCPSGTGSCPSGG